MKTQGSNSSLSRLTIDIPTELHRVIKANATLENHSIKEYVLEALEEKLKNKSKVKNSKSKIKNSKSKNVKTKIVETKLTNDLNKRTAALLIKAGKAKKVTFLDKKSAMNYLTK